MDFKLFINFESDFGLGNFRVKYDSDLNYTEHSGLDWHCHCHCHCDGNRIETQSEVKEITRDAMAASIPFKGALRVLSRPVFTQACWVTVRYHWTGQPIYRLLVVLCAT